MIETSFRFISNTTANGLNLSFLLFIEVERPQFLYSFENPHMRVLLPPVVTC